MGWFNGCVLYVLIWWVALFAVLPWGIRAQPGPDALTGWRGAPEHPRLLRTAVATTIVAGIVWLGAYWLISSPYLSFREGWLAMPVH
ncbi:MAG: DUF1467 family protein [Acetobacteraceae bacterium]|nr:DUF1467 family protein [Acetobacteraceae bacterium]